MSLCYEHVNLCTYHILTLMTLCYDHIHILCYDHVYLFMYILTLITLCYEHIKYIYVNINSHILLQLLAILTYNDINNIKKIKQCRTILHIYNTMYEVTSSTYSFEQLQNHNIHLPSYRSSKSKYNLIEETVRHKSTRYHHDYHHYQQHH
jgi:hypothetical protein